MNESLLIPGMVTAARHGEKQAWDFLYHQHYPYLYAIALRVLGNTPAAKDAVQDAFLLAFTRLDQLKDPRAFKGWIKRILVHDCFRKRRSKRYTGIDTIPLANDSWWEDEFERKLESFSRKATLHEAITRLTEPLRCALLLRYFTAFQSYEQIAAILCIPEGTVRSRLNQAKTKLMEFWQQGSEVSEHIYKQSEEWSGFYLHHFSGMYHNESVRQKLMGHFEQKVEITFTSGKSDGGRDYLEKEINDDLYYGTHYQPFNVITSDNVSIVEGTNYNPPEYPDRCPESSVFVLFRDKSTVSRVNLYNSPH